MSFSRQSAEGQSSPSLGLVGSVGSVGLTQQESPSRLVLGAEKFESLGRSLAVQAGLGWEMWE